MKSVQRCFNVLALLLAVSGIGLSARVPGRSIDAFLYYETLSHHASRVTRQADVVHLHFTAFNRTFETELTPSQEGFHPEVKFMYQGKQVQPYTFYKGRLQGEPHSTVKGHVIDGLFDGVVHSNRIDYHIERASKYFNTEQSFHSVIYRGHDVHSPATAGCGAKGEMLKNLEATQARARPTKEDPVLYGKDRYRRQVTSSENNFCQMRIAADHLFLANIGGGDPAAAMAEMVAIMTEVQTIFRDTDFNGDGTRVIPLVARVEILNQNSPEYLFNSPSIGVNDYLDFWSRSNHNEFCLALLLTYRDFANGVLGLAWVSAPPGGNRGGICEGLVNLPSGPRFLNTAIVTMLNFGQRQPRSVTIITTAHELGHNFGSPHDPAGECSPGFGSGGNFIMFPSATDGAQTNNRLFSSCSRNSIRSVLQSARANCFTATGSFCGNGVVEDGEECDCGTMCTNDPCCDDECHLTNGSVCSSSQICCNASCQYRETGFQCRERTECGQSVNCTGTSAVCPQPESIGNEGEIVLCNDNMNFCVDGVCSGSLCLREGLDDCQCAVDTTPRTECDVCCMVDGECISSFSIQQIAMGQRREAGRSCGDFTGYCDSNGICQNVDNEDTLNDLLDIFTLDTLNTVVAWLAANWYIPVGVVIGLVILIILLQVTYRRRKPIKSKFRQARSSLRRRGRGGVSEAQTGGVGGAASRDQQRRQAPQRQISPREALNRLNHFFPNADRQVIQNVIENTRSESKAVKKLLERGYPMRRVPIPRA